jgi:hypothetical protein
MAAQYFGALQKASDKLKQYYKYNLSKLEALGSTVGSDTRLPWYSLYHDLADSIKHSIRYSSQSMPNKLIFIGESDGTEVCVKFATRYSREHTYSALPWGSLTLRGFEALPGRWFMVVMDQINDVFMPL